MITIEFDDHDEVVSLTGADGQPLPIHGIHGLIRALERYETKNKIQNIDLSKPYLYVIGKPMALPTMVGAEKPAEDVPAPQHPLAQFVAKAFRRDRVGDKVLERLTARVDGHPSPTELWDNPLFQVYVKARYDYWFERDGRDIMHLVNSIRAYQTPEFGWLDFEMNHKPPAPIGNAEYGDV